MFYLMNDQAIFYDSKYLPRYPIPTTCVTAKLGPNPGIGTNYRVYNYQIGHGPYAIRVIFWNLKLDAPVWAPPRVRAIKKADPSRFTEFVCIVLRGIVWLNDVWVGVWTPLSPNLLIGDVLVWQRIDLFQLIREVQLNFYRLNSKNRTCSFATVYTKGSFEGFKDVGSLCCATILIQQDEGKLACTFNVIWGKGKSLHKVECLCL